MAKYVTRQEAVSVLYDLINSGILSGEIEILLEETAACIRHEEDNLSLWGADTEVNDLFVMKRADLIDDEWNNHCEELYRRYSTHSIYAITCMTRLEATELGWPDFGSTAFMGYCLSKEDASEAVENNACNIAENCYDFAVIEEIPSGLYGCPTNRWFFKYDAKNDVYIQIEEPEFMEHIASVL